MFQVYEPIVLAAGGSNTPENQTICKQLGLGDHRMSYYATRSAPLGRVGAEVVSATFYHHSVEMVSPAIPLAWSIASPERIVAARFEAVDQALRRLLPQQIESAEIAEAVALVREACWVVQLPADLYSQPTQHFSGRVNPTSLCGMVSIYFESIAAMDILAQ